MYDRRDRFVTDSIATASPQHLLCLLYDRLALDVQRATAALDGGERSAAAGHARHAQDIVFELRSTLDVSVWDGGPALASLYGWLITELGKVVVHGDAAAASACYGAIEPLRQAWREAATTATAERPTAAFAATA
jgi:flagellar protein FliS